MGTPYLKDMMFIKLSSASPDTLLRVRCPVYLFETMPDAAVVHLQLLRSREENLGLHGLQHHFWSTWKEADG